MKHVLVTGGNGFIGRYVVEELCKRGKHVAVLDRHRESAHQHKEHRCGQPDLYFGDVKDQGLVSEAVAHVDGVIHLAGVLGTQETVDHPKAAAETNILGGLNVIEACAQYDVPLINIAVGNYWMNNTYSITKNSIERFVEMTRKYRGKAMGSVRALNAYGPRQVPVAPYGPSRVRKIMPSFVCRALTGEPIEIYGDGSQIMDMIYVTDVAYILASALDLLDSSGSIETIEAGTGRETTVAQIADEVVSQVRFSADVDARVEFLPMRKGEDEKSVVLADTSNMEQQLGITPDKLVTLETGVAHTIEYFREYLRDR